MALTTITEPWVRATDDRMVFEVRSRSAAKRGKVARYRVDLLAFGGHGQCHCKSWQTRNWPKIRDGGSIGAPATVCWHVKMARWYFLNQLLELMAKQEQQQST